jgi:MFS family permease
MAESSAPTTIQTDGRRWKIILIGAAVALYWSSLYLYMPTLPTYAEDRIGNLTQVGVVLSMYGLWQAVVRLPLGILADWVGRRKPFILLGFALSAAGAWLMMTSQGYTGMLAGRAITGLAAAAWVPLTVLFSSMFPPRDAVRATAALMLINALSRVLSTGVTGSLNALGGYGLAFALAAGVAGLAALAILPVREKPLPAQRPSPRAIGALITRRDVLLPSLLSMIAQYVTWATTFGFLPILARNLGASDAVNSLLVSLNLLLGMAGNLAVTALARRTGSRPLLLAGLLLIALGVGVAAAAPSLAFVLVAQALMGLGFGAASPLTMGLSIQRVDEHQRATAMGLHQSVYAIGMFAGPWLSGILAASMGIQPMFAITAAACLVISIGLTRLLES